MKDRMRVHLRSTGSHAKVLLADAPQFVCGKTTAWATFGSRGVSRTRRYAARRSCWVANPSANRSAPKIPSRRRITIHLRFPSTAVMNSDTAKSSGNAQPIGVFDSGIGGLTVVSALRTLLPNESIFYLGDTARVPYGGKSAATVQRYSLEIATMLLSENAKTVVVACNTASALALAQLTAALPVPVTGVIQPGAQAAIAATRNGHIGVIGTRATINSGAYERALRSLDSKVQVSARACPLLVPLVEEGWLPQSIPNQPNAAQAAPAPPQVAVTSEVVREVISQN